MPELTPDADAVWRAFAGSIAPDDGMQARVLQRVRARTKAQRGGVDVDDVDDEENGSRNARRAAAAVLVVKSSAISVSIAGGALLSIKLIAAAVYAPPVPPAPTIEIPEPPAVERSADVGRAEVPTPAPSASAAPPVVVPPSSPATSPPPAHHVAPPVATTSDEDRLRVEIDLVGRMRDALQAGELARALELVETHRRDFRDGSFIEEREAYQAIAACRKGDAGGAALAQRFATSRPRSSQLAAVRAACDSAANESMDPAARQQ